MWAVEFGGAFAKHLWRLFGYIVGGTISGCHGLRSPVGPGSETPPYFFHIYKKEKKKSGGGGGALKDLQKEKMLLFSSESRMPQNARDSTKDTTKSPKCPSYAAATVDENDITDEILNGKK